MALIRAAQEEKGAGMTKYCPKCDEEMEHIDDDPDVGIVGGWVCPGCEHTVNDDPADFEDPELGI